MMIVWEPSYSPLGREGMWEAPARKGRKQGYCWATKPCLALQPRGLQHTALAHPSPSPWVCSDSCPSSRWCHPTISSSVPPLLLPSVFTSIRVFSSELVLRVRWPKYWSSRELFLKLGSEKNAWDVAWSSVQQLMTLALGEVLRFSNYFVVILWKFIWNIENEYIL